MTDRTAAPYDAEAPPDAPSARALGAMESAVRRVRATGQPGTLEAHTPPDPYRPVSAPGHRPVAWTDRWAGADRDRWLGIAVVVLAVMVVAAGIALIVSLDGGGTQQMASSPVPPSASTVTPAHHGSVHRPGGTGAASTTTSVVATPGGPPVISSLSPSTGGPGQSITIAGANFLSSDGRIVASFNGEVASTRCPASNTCTVTVPPPNGASTAQVTVTTAAGASNAMSFTYG